MGDGAGVRLITRPLTEALRSQLRAIPKQYSPFSASYSDTLLVLDREVNHIAKRGADPVLMIDIEERHLRLDGSLRADARPASDNVALAVETENGPLIFPCGRFWKWQDNVRAIALGMEALRKVERYGITPNAEQYTGFRAIGSGIPMPAATMTVEEAGYFIAEQAQVNANHSGIITDPAYRDWAYRAAVKRLHPDAGGDPAMFRKLTEARDLLVGAI